MISLFVDGDACPVKAEVEKVAGRHNLSVTIVSNGGLRPSANPLLRHIIVAEGADAADDWIVEHIAAGDICITADIPLASRCLEKGARVLGPNGKARNLAAMFGLKLENHYARLPGEFYTLMPAEKVGVQPRLLHANPKAAALIGMDAGALSDPVFTQIFSGHAQLGDFTPLWSGPIAPSMMQAR